MSNTKNTFGASAAAPARTDRAGSAPAEEAPPPERVREAQPPSAPPQPQPTTAAAASDLAAPAEPSAKMMAVQPGRQQERQIEENEKEAALAAAEMSAPSWSDM